LPFRLFGKELFPAERRQAIELGPLSLVGELPGRRDPAFPLEAMHAGIQRSGFDLEQIVRRPLDVFRDRVTVHRSREKGAKDQQIERALQQLHAGVPLGTHCVDSLLYAIAQLRVTAGRLRHRIVRAIMSATVDIATGGVERCVSCDAPLSGPYCARCGERSLEPDALTLRHFLVHTVAHELLHVDGALWRTLRLLFAHPGRLSLEYAAGRRRPYINPFRLLLIGIVVYALTASSGLVTTWNFGPVTVSMAPAAVRRSLSVETTIDQIDHYGLLRQQLAAKKAALAS